MAILVTGGARSGKSRFAEQYAMRSTSSSGIYVATCQPFDDEMKERISLHRNDREASLLQWETVEVPYTAAELLIELAERFSADRSANMASNQTCSSPPVILLDCLTLWLTNWLLRVEEQSDGDRILAVEVNKLVAAVEQYPYPLILVSNEVGDGIVPDYPLGRRFRDEAGRLNQRLAAVCERVFLVTAGIPIELKAIAFRWEDL